MPDKRFKDLGNFTKPVLVFGGPYGNFQATVALLAQAAALNIDPENIICTGDVVAYCGEPAATVEAIRAAGIHVVMGNCEKSLGNDLQDCGCGFDAGSACDILSVQWFAHASRSLGDDAKKWMADLPRGLTFTMNNRRVAVIHGGTEEIGRFIFNSTPTHDKRREFDNVNVDGVIGGHCGLPFNADVDGRIWHNPGVIGMPANDATPRTWFSILTPGPEGIDFALRPLAYDHVTAARRMRQEGLPEPYATTLETGLWPNMDVLPPFERAVQGRALMPERFFWAKG